MQRMKTRGPASVLALFVLLGGCTNEIDTSGLDAWRSKVGEGGAGGAGPTEWGAGFCGVRTLLGAQCLSCHADPPLASVPVSLASYDDLLAAAPSDPSRRVIDVSLARMRSQTAPMPPRPASPASPDDIALLEAWIEDGMPDSCDGSGLEPGIYDTPTVCTSDRHWTRGNEESPNMHPGRACIACHSGSGSDEEDEGPAFLFAGTVYPSAHEPDDCYGIDGRTQDAKVVIVDANGKALTLSVNAAGNFYYESERGFAKPYTAKVVHGGRERVMATPQKNGDCNSCHTEAGTNQAPARILLP